jgi:hypothetical protein
MSEPPALEKKKNKSIRMLFRKSKSDVSSTGRDDADSAAEKVTVRKAKSFKRIRGFLTGSSRRSKSSMALSSSKTASSPQTTAPSRAAENEPEDMADDESTIYGVDVDDRSVATERVPALPDKLMAANNMGETALLALTNAAEEAAASEDHEAFFASEEFKKKPYMLKVVLLLMDPDTGICGRAGVEMTPNKLLATFCNGNDVLVAIPTGIPAKECARLARPILSDEKVVAMVRVSVDEN